jgi:tRNA dimethylallyltransferase
VTEPAGAARLCPLIAVVGPTGSGKSDLAVELAAAFRGEIVNCDSVQLYRYLDIGTAKTPLRDRRGIPHHLIDVLDPDQIFTAGDYAHAARSVLSEITRRGYIPIVTGGTGFYFRALTAGLFEAPSRDEKLRHTLTQRTPARLHRLLQRLDPAAASRIHPNDSKKVVRALEVCILTRRPVSEQQPDRRPLTGYRILTLGLDPPRDQLAVHINSRCLAMFDGGLVSEVRNILASGFSPDSKALESIGYREALMHIAGEISLEQASERAQASTRQYAKRQRTWFRREADVHWIHSFGNQPETIEIAKSLVESFLGELEVNAENEQIGI